MPDFTKYAYEEIFRYFQFKRPDGQDGLGAAEILSSQAVTCAEKETLVDTTATMISDTGIYDNTQVIYKIKGGTVGKSYYVYVRAITSTGQKLEGDVIVTVK